MTTHFTDQDFEKSIKIFGINTEKKLIRELQEAFVYEDIEALNALSSHPKLKDVITDFNLINCLKLILTDGNIHLIKNFFYQNNLKNGIRGKISWLIYFETTLLQENKREVDFSHEELTIVNLLNAFKNGDLNYLKDNVLNNLAFKDIHKKTFISYLRKDNFTFNLKSFAFLYKNSFFNNGDLIKIFDSIIDINSNFPKRNRVNFKKLFCLSEYPEIMPILTKEELFFSEFNDIYRVNQMLNYSAGFSRKLLMSISLNPLTSSDVILSGLMNCIKYNCTFKDEELEQIISLFNKNLNNGVSATKDHKEIFNLDSEQVNLIHKTSILLKEKSYLLNEYFQHNLSLLSINNVNKDLLPFVNPCSDKNTENLYINLDTDVFNEQNAQNKQGKYSKESNIKNTFNKNKQTLFISNLLIRLIFDNDKVIFNLKDNDTLNTINKLFINKPTKNNILGVILALKNEKKVDSLIKHLKKEEKNEVFIFKVTDYISKKEGDIKIKKPMFFLYAAFQYGSKKLLKEMLKDNKIMNYLMAHQHITDDIINKTSLPEDRKQILITAIANFHKENLGINKQENGSLNKAKQKLKI